MSAKHTPGPWRYEPGGGHAHNSIRGADSVQVGGWLVPRGGVYNANYSDRVCENLGDTTLPAPAANACLIAAAPELLAALKMALAHWMFKDWPEQAAHIQRVIAKAEGTEREG